MNKTKCALVCRHCGISLTSKGGLRTHELRHVGQGTYTCCDKTFYSAANLQRHQCAVHKAEKNHVCVKCGKAFATNADLQKHRRREDGTGLKCEVCGMVLSDKSKLEDHMDKHNNNNKNHHCPVCNKAFRYASNLSRHKTVHT